MENTGIFTCLKESSFHTAPEGNTAVIIIEGHGLFQFADTIDSFTANSIFILQPDQTIRLVNSSSHLATFAVFHFPPSLLLVNRFNFHAAELLEKHFREHGPCLRFTINEKSRLHISLYEPLLSYTPDLTTPGTAMAFAHLYTSMFIFLTDAWLSGYSSGSAKENLTSKTEQTIYKTKQYIHENYDRPVTLEDLARYTQLNAAYLSRLFKNQTGTTITAYIRQVRINHARTLLANTNDLIIDIAYACGFPNVCTFNIAFKQLTGSAPGEYRKASRSLYCSQPLF